jgi:4-hydroxyproline epimerase
MFYCIDGHTAGNPVRLVVAGAPFLRGADMSARRLDFTRRFDWIRNGLMFEPRGHDVMSGGFVYPPLQEAHDAAILFIETSGALPMCGHGSIGMITFALEHGLITPSTPGRLRIEVPAGLLEAAYRVEGRKVTSVKLTNVPSFLFARGVEVEDPELGPLSVDVAYGGNFYAIIEPQGPYRGVDALGADAILRISPRLRAAVAAKVQAVHPLDPSISGVSHVLWADPLEEGAGRGAVFYGEKAIDRSPCGTGGSARGRGSSTGATSAPGSPPAWRGCARWARSRPSHPPSRARPSSRAIISSSSTRMSPSPRGFRSSDDRSSPAPRRTVLTPRPGPAVEPGAMSIEIRPASLDDAPEIRRLTREAYAKWVPVIGREPQPMEADYEAAVRAHAFSLLFVDGVLAALVETVDEGEVLLVVNLAVSPRFQGRGLGSRLLEAAEERARARRCARIRLYTNRRFEENVRLYLRRGYEVDREEPAGSLGVRVHMSKRVQPGSPL